MIINQSKYEKFGMNKNTYYEPFFFSSGARPSFLDLACPVDVSLTSTHKRISKVPVKTQLCVENYFTLKFANT